MKTPEWLKPALWGAAAGAVALTIVGFSLGGWVTAGKAEKMATDRAKAEVVAALVPICIEQARQDPEADQRLASLRDARGTKRRDIVIDAGWATMPGQDAPDRTVANACMERLASEL